MVALLMHMMMKVMILVANMMQAAITALMAVTVLIRMVMLMML